MRVFYKSQQGASKPLTTHRGTGDEMYIETERLVVRSLNEQDAEALLELQHDKQIMKFHPSFFFNNATVDFVKGAISHFQGLAEKGLLFGEHGSLFSVSIKKSGEVIGFNTFNKHLLINEWHMGWYFLSRYTGKGYASEASEAASSYFLDAMSLDYISAGMRDHNPASFRVAQKSGFKLIERRIGFDYEKCSASDFNAVNEYFDNIKSGNGLYSYYFQKIRKKS
jgi:ribosomal-protein-alanine N-acetyltransferase